MTDQAVAAIATIVTQLGVSGIFVYLFFSSKKDHREIMERKDNDFKELSQKVLQLVESNIQTSESLKNSVDNNTKSTDKLVDTVDRILRK